MISPVDDVYDRLLANITKQRERIIELTNALNAACDGWEREWNRRDHELRCANPDIERLRKVGKP